MLPSRKEIEEPFEAEQIGSSAMAYKRNPMRGRADLRPGAVRDEPAANARRHAATQWMERTLDDSANRRLSLPQAFLAIDASLMLYRNITSGLVVYPHVIASRLAAELPFMATENILMAAVQAAAIARSCTSGSAYTARPRRRRSNSMAVRTISSSVWPATRPSPASIWACALDPQQYIGRAPEQVDAFVRDHVEPLLTKYAYDLDEDDADVRV